MSICSIPSKIFLIFIGFIFWCAAAGLLFLGAYVYKEYENYNEIGDAFYTLIPATITLVVGVLFFFFGLIGCIGALKEQRCLLGCFFTFLLILFLGMVVTSVLGYVFRREVDNGMDDGLTSAFDKYGQNDTTLTKEIDFMQEEMKCCGSSNYTDWANTTWGIEWTKEHSDWHFAYPESCCVDKNCTYDLPPTDPNSTLYQSGCYDKMRKGFMHSLGIIGGVAGSIAILLLIGMGCSCVLICRKKEKHDYVGLTSNEHMRV